MTILFKYSVLFLVLLRLLLLLQCNSNLITISNSLHQLSVSVNMVDSYTAVTEYTVNASVILEWHFTELIKSINRKITTRQSYRKPWFVSTKRTINKEVFGVWYEALVNFIPKIGFSIEETWYKTRPELKSVVFTFTKLGVFVFHLQKITNNDIDVPKYFRKTFKCKTEAVIRVDDDKPAKITFIYSNEQICIDVFYIATNEYGTILSF